MDRENHMTTDLPVSIMEWFSLNPEEEMRRRLFYVMSYTMKLLHERGYYIESMDPKSIGIDPVQNVLFRYAEGKNQNFEKQNIYDFACLAVAAYANCLPFLNGNTDIIKDHFEDFATFIPSEDVPYFQGIIERGDRVYYSDFRDYLRDALLRKAQQEAAQTGTSLDTNDAGGRGRSMTYSTPQGRMMTEKENIVPLPGTGKENNDLGNAAFLKTVVLPAFVLLVALLGTILFFLIYGK